MKFEKKFITKYLDTIIQLSNETGMSKKEVKTTVPGNIWKVLVKVGDTVKKDDDLFIMEVMKTEVHHNSPVDGKVIQVNIQNDQEAVEPGTVAIIIE